MARQQLKKHCFSLDLILVVSALDCVEEVSLADPLRTIPPEDKAKFDKLVKTLKELLTDIKGYKVGDEAERELFIVGKTKEGQWAGLKTSVVET
jgi:hypothetical protein